MTELRSALIVAVPEAARAVDGWRERSCTAKSSNGVPAHVTLLFPFVPVPEIDGALLAELCELFGQFQSFSFELRELRRFPSVLYLPPEPSGPFVQMTEALVASYPDYPPYGAIFDSIVPHMTVAEGEPELLDKAERDIRIALPITAQAIEVILIEEVEPDPASWQTRARIPLGASS
ncbi:MAG: 2'-5' RNA ligase family protein [Gaiellaceae bacterium]